MAAKKKVDTWQDVVENMAIQAGMVAIMGVTANKAKFAKFMDVLLKVADAIYTAAGRQVPIGK